MEQIKTVSLLQKDSLQIIIHRGIDQIGGCITEIATQKTRILIDLGQNLPDGNGIVTDNFASAKAVENITKGIDAIFYTHYHGDHLGLFSYVPEGINQYIGRVAKRVALCKHRRLGLIKGRETISANEIEKMEQMLTFDPNHTVTIGDIKVTPFFVSHSAYDAYLFLTEANGTRIIHTGDFRGHGYLSKGLLPMIKKLILPRGKIDFLITEGTMLSRLDERVQHEREVGREMAKVMKQYKNVFVMCSSTDLERLASIHSAHLQSKGRPFICDDFQKDILSIFSETAGKESDLFNFGDPYNFRKENTKLITWMKDKGFCMLVRATDKFNDYLNFLEPHIDLNDTVLIYSMWSEYINPGSDHANTRYLDFTGKFQTVKSIHTSGHASADCLAELVSAVNPTLGIIPIHSEHSASFNKLPIDNDLKSKIITTSKIFNGMSVEIPVSK